MTGLITHIQRMSLHDGPGIRSTIFMKGCNLRCVWCHNPETFSALPELGWAEQKCIQCHACLTVCPSGAMMLKFDRIGFDKSKCMSCFDCVNVCYPEAIYKVGKSVTAGALVDETRQDFEYFYQSGGGITFSGGEPLLQTDFIVEALTSYKSENIHTAIETNLSMPWEKYMQILPITDLIMADIKMINSEKHKQFTGKTNDRILTNILKLDQTGVRYILRTPLVPGINDDSEEKAQIEKFVGGIKNLEKHEWLPYHGLANGKYKNLGIPKMY